MQFGEFGRFLIEHKKGLLVYCCIGFLFFAIFGYVNRNNINEDIVYCSKGNIIFDREDQTANGYSSGVKLSKNLAIATDDTTVNESQAMLNGDGVKISSDEIKESVIVNEGEDVIEIIASNSDSGISEKICSSYTECVFENISTYDEDAILLNKSSKPFSARVSTDSSGNVTVVPTDITEITATYICKEVVKYGMMGAVLFLFIGILIYSIRMFLKNGERR